VALPVAAKAKEGQKPAALFSWFIKEHRAQQHIIGNDP
jgi:hypothetical protein